MPSPSSPGPAPAPSPAVFAARREALLARTGSGVVVLGAGPEQFRSRDTEVRYRPNTDLFYLTGVEEPEAVAVLTPHDPRHRFTLFVRPRDPEREVWNGPRLGVEGAVRSLGADAAYPIGELAQRLPDLLRPADRVVCALGAHPAIDELVIEALRATRRTRPRSGTGPTGVDDLDALLAPMRLVKDEWEVGRIRVAARIAAAGHVTAIERARPGAGEWELEAALEGSFRAQGATGPAFPSIVGSGPNGTVLHYTANARRMEAGELVLLDAGAEWGMYCSDISRTVPVSGRFSEAQRELYDVVLAAEEAGIAAVRPGEPVSGVHDAAARVLVEGLLRLGLVQGSDVDAALSEGGYRRFYMHQTSHWLGLDVHDVGPYREGAAPTPLRPGMVLTVEPGLYIPADADGVPERYRGIGIRIEDSVLVSEDGHEVLTREVPVAPDELEALTGRAGG